jgi:hypothetical protein
MPQAYPSLATNCVRRAAGAQPTDGWVPDELPAIVTNCGLPHTTARDRSSVNCALVLRPESSTQARMPPTVQSAPRGARRGLLVLIAGPVTCFYRRYPTVPVASSLPDGRSGAPAVPPATVQRATGRPPEMTRTEREQDARTRGQLARERGAWRLSLAIEAQRRLNATRTDGRPANGPSGDQGQDRRLIGDRGPDRPAA